MKQPAKKILLLTRIMLGLIFLWAFVDKLFGLGFSTKPDASWLDGVSPTAGFLKFATHGPFATAFQSLAGNPAIDWIFMIGLLGIGIGLITGLALRFSCASGVVMLLLMYLAALPPVHHPFLDEHIIYALILFYIAMENEPVSWRQWLKRIKR